VHSVIFAVIKKFRPSVPYKIEFVVEHFSYIVAKSNFQVYNGGENSINSCHDQL
jgi:hypothetical protein